MCTQNTGVHREKTQSFHNACLWLKSLAAQDCSVIIVRMKRVCHPVSHVISLLVSTSPSSPPQHEAPPGQHDLLQDDTLHRTPLPEPIQSTSSSQEPLSNVNCESGGNPRTKTPTPSGAEHEMWIDGYRVEYWTAAVWITVDIVTCCILMVSTWWKAGRVVETTDSGTQTLDEGKHDQCIP